MLRRKIEIVVNEEDCKDIVKIIKKYKVLHLTLIDKDFEEESIRIHNIGKKHAKKNRS